MESHNAIAGAKSGAYRDGDRQKNRHGRSCLPSRISVARSHSAGRIDSVLPGAVILRTVAMSGQGVFGRHSGISLQPLPAGY